MKRTLLGSRTSLELGLFALAAALVVVLVLSLPRRELVPWYTPETASGIDSESGFPRRVCDLLTNREFVLVVPQAQADVTLEHGVPTKPFYLAVREVTQEDYFSILGRNPSLTQDRRAPRRFDDHPVDSVPLDRARDYARALHVRLPSQQEWEYACLVGERGLVVDRDYYWCTDDPAHAESHPVGTKKANLFGIHDLRGNVAEWCSDSDGPLALMAWGHAAMGGSCASACDKMLTRLSVGIDPGDPPGYVGIRLAGDP